MKEPESQETLDAEFDVHDLTAKECMGKVEDLLISLRKDAAALAGEWLVKHGYFNGDINNHVSANDNTIIVSVVLTCYGLPLRVDDSTYGGE